MKRKNADIVDNVSKAEAARNEELNTVVILLLLVVGSERFVSLFLSTELSKSLIRGRTHDNLRPPGASCCSISCTHACTQQFGSKQNHFGSRGRIIRDFLLLLAIGTSSCVLAGTWTIRRSDAERFTCIMKALRWIQSGSCIGRLSSTSLW